MHKIHLLFLRLSDDFRRLASRLWGTYQASRWLRIGSALAAVHLVAVLCLAIYVSYNRIDLPDLQAFIRFEPPTTGHIYDANGHVLVELGKERREIMQYNEIPDVLREAILSAEDENFFSHSGVDYSVFPRLLRKINVAALFTRSQGAKGEHGGARASVFPQGGSTLTQQLVRGFFLQRLTGGKNGNTLQHEGVVPHVLAFVVGVPGANRILLKVEEMRLSFWIEGEMRKRYGSKRRAKEELLARYASFIYLGNGRYGFAAASQYYFGMAVTKLTAEDADKAALLAGITKSPGEYAPTPHGNAKALHRRNQILALMAKNHFLTAQAAERSQQRPIRLAARAAGPVEAPAAVGNALDELKRMDAGLGQEIGVSGLLQGRIQIHSTIDDRIQSFANEALENGLKLYEKRHPQNAGLIQGSVVVLRNSDAAILAEAGGRRTYKGHTTSYGDYNRVSQSMRQPGSTMKPIVYLAAFRQGALDLGTPVPDEPIWVTTSADRPVKWIVNFDSKFEGIIPARRALAESRNAVAIWIVQQIGIDAVLRTARDIGIRSALHRYDTTALGASEVTLLELANAYRMMASGVAAEPYVIARIERGAGDVVYGHAAPCCPRNANELELAMIQEGLRGVVRIPSGTAHALDARSFPIPVMGKTGTTNSYRDALFVGSTYGVGGITVAVRIGFDDNRSLGKLETGSKAALPIFREFILKVYQEKLVGPAPRFPVEMEARIDAYLRGAEPETDAPALVTGLGAARVPQNETEGCAGKLTLAPTNRCAWPSRQQRSIFASKNEIGRVVFVNE